MALQDVAEMDRLRIRLQDRAAELQSEIDALRAEEAGALGKAPGGHVEDAAEQGEQRTRNAVRDVERRRDVEELLQVTAALDRMRDGLYGDCIDCGCSIPLARLLVQPAAARCIGCQEKFEQPGPAARVRAP